MQTPSRNTPAFSIWSDAKYGQQMLPLWGSYRSTFLLQGAVVLVPPVEMRKRKSTAIRYVCRLLSPSLLGQVPKLDEVFLGIEISCTL